MNCPVCQKELIPDDENFIRCIGDETDEPELIHHFDYTISYPHHPTFIIVLAGIYFEHFETYWVLSTFNESESDQELTENKLSQGYDRLSPEEAYKLLLRYNNLLAFS